MLKIVVTEKEAGQRLDKLLGRYLKKAPVSFVYKMLRKKNIKLNGKKAQGNEKMQVGDEVVLYLSDETIAEFSEEKKIQKSPYRTLKLNGKIQVVYEDANVLLLNKPSGVLSQKAQAGDISMNEYMLAYLLQKGEVSEEGLEKYRPSICNRLDRNTSGILTVGKTLPALQRFGELFSDRTMEKYYLTVVKGKIEQPNDISGYLLKNENTNKVTISKENHGGQKIETSYVPLETNGRITLLEVHLITGRSHQIRAHLASIGHPVIGDTKYGEQKTNQYFQKSYGLHSQILHAYKMKFETETGALKGLSGRTFYAEMPTEMRKILKGENLIWEPGIQEG